MKEAQLAVVGDWTRCHSRSCSSASRPQSDTRQNNVRLSRSFPDLLPIVGQAESLTIRCPVQKFWLKSMLAVTRCHPVLLQLVILRIICFFLLTFLGFLSLIDSQHRSSAPFRHLGVVIFITPTTATPFRSPPSVVSAFGTVKAVSTSILSL